MLRSFTSSFSGKIMSISYTLKVYVKHDAWNQFGEGEFVTMKIMILQPPLNVVSQEQE